MKLAPDFSYTCQKSWACALWQLLSTGNADLCKVPSSHGVKAQLTELRFSSGGNSLPPSCVWGTFFFFFFLSRYLSSALRSMWRAYMSKRFPPCFFQWEFEWFVVWLDFPGRDSMSLVWFMSLLRGVCLQRWLSLPGLCLTSEHLFLSLREKEIQKPLIGDTSLMSLIVLFLFYPTWRFFDCVEMQSLKSVGEI